LKILFVFILLFRCSELNLNRIDAINDYFKTNQIYYIKGQNLKPLISNEIITGKYNNFDDLKILSYLDSLGINKNEVNNLNELKFSKQKWLSDFNNTSNQNCILFFANHRKNLQLVEIVLNSNLDATYKEAIFQSKSILYLFVFKGDKILRAYKERVLYN
jgi:hypothetical protein